MTPDQLVLPVLIIVAFYFLIIRPSRNRQRAQQRLGEQLAVGVRVMTTSGLFAEVVGFEDDGVLLSPAPGVTMRWTKAAVARILPEPDVEDESGEGETDPDEEAADVSDALDPDSTADTAADSTERPT